ncbi:MAG: aspartyl/asparaginyl beta-hydroxylase domain-containing protein [Xanthomonadaceae bacterium]|nr:aspartyl/asparaginyl beta-hydroxylase domain-containing protein [Xanthomonadaceae bacterium]MDE2258681.1 aspartyl/asparaginyl beta-hydroxylase domain-containing protein [Xanthomonadaceae bacterium]
MNANLDSAAAALERARQLAAAGRGEDARAEYDRVLAVQPEHAEALAFLGSRELALGRPPNAIDYLQRAARSNPDEAQIQLSLGSAYLAARRLDEARAALARCLELAPTAYVARLQYATVLEQSGTADAALAQYFGAIVQAQNQGRWLSDASTSPLLRAQVKHAMRFSFDGRKRLFEALLAPYIARHGEAAMARVAKCLKTYLGEIAPNYPDPRQIPKFLYFPDLPPATYFDRVLFPWYEILESCWTAIREELNAVMREPHTLAPFLGDHPPEAIKGYLGGVENPVWDAYFFYRHGERFDAHHARCPRTSAALESLPTLVRIREHAPEVCFSVLTPGTHILKHRGVTNTRLVTHLPLIIPDNCAISVGGEERVWREGECFSFDDTYEHEAWNRSDRTRVVMLLDVWNPYMTAAECEAITGLIEGIGDFNQAAGIDRH